MSSALAAPYQPFRKPESAERRPDGDAINLRLNGSLETALRKGVRAVYAVLTRRSDDLLNQAVESTCRRMKSRLPEPDDLSASAVQFRVVPVDGRNLGIEAALIVNGRIPPGAAAVVRLALTNTQKSFDALKGL